MMPDDWAESPGDVVPRPLGGRPKSPKHQVVEAGLASEHPLRKAFPDLATARAYVKDMRSVARQHGAKLRAGYRQEGKKTVAVIQVYKEEK